MKNLGRKYNAWRTERQRRLKLVRELSAYSDRDLLELGFSCHDFPAIVNHVSALSDPPSQPHGGGLQGL